MLISTLFNTLIIVRYTILFLMLSGVRIMAHITANDLKTKGIAAIEASLANHPEAIVSVRGKDSYVVMDLAHYHYLRECELEAALAETRANLKTGQSVKETPEEHMARLDKINLAK